MTIMRLIPILVLSLAACSSPKPVPAPAGEEAGALGAGRYAYTASSQSGDPLVTGTLTIDSSAAAAKELSGTWDLHWAEGADTTAEVGPQLGTGRFDGIARGDSVAIGLNPGFADNNVNLRGAWNAGRITGSWEWDTFAGPRTRGTFVLERR